MKKHIRDIAVDANEMRRSNAELVLRLIWEREAISRAEIARTTGLSASTVSDIIAELRDLDLVEEKGTGESSGGRRPILMGINERRAYIIGIEVGSAHITAVAVTLRGTILGSRRITHPTRDEPESTCEKVHESIEWLTRETDLQSNAMLGIGVAVPCPVNPRAPGDLSRLILPAWSGFDLRKELIDRYARPVFIENDANAGALAELWWGERDRVRNLAYVKVATGIGAGFIIDGRLYRGADGSAGEIGHLSVDPKGARCICGSRGCLTTVTGTQSILEKAKHIALRDGSNVTDIPGFIAATMEGDRDALEIVNQIGKSLGNALAGLLNTLNPRVVVLGGELTNLGDVLFDPLRVALRRQAIFSSVARTKIVASSLGSNAIAVGSTALVLDAALDNLELFSGAAKAAWGDPVNEKTFISLILIAILVAFGSMSCSSDSDSSSDPLEGWELAWSDEFDGDDGELPDPDIWSFDVGGNGFGNNQLEYNTDRPENASLDGDGNLAIVARREGFQGNLYTSARIKTQGTVEVEYGRIEARISLPEGQGIWPAFWMLGNDFETIGWPQCGEIDIMEYRGQEPAIVHGSVHGPGYSAGQAITEVSAVSGGAAGKFHVYAVEWEPDEIRWYVDDVMYHSFTPEDLPSGTPWVYDHPFFLILNVAVGGNFVGSPDASTQFPQTMLVDYVRVYERND